jgi:DNA-3-methyladenine glycosylase
MKTTDPATKWQDRTDRTRLLRESHVLGRGFYSRPPQEVAPDLLGKILVHGEAAGMIVEVEAYLGKGDLAAHSSRGITPRTRVIFGPPGHAYVYFVYGMYECLNFVTMPDGEAGCVLIRAVEPWCGIRKMKERRASARRIEDLASGPGNLTLAFGITRRNNGTDLTKGALTVRELEHPPAFQVGITPRIGIRRCADLPLRFCVEGNPCVSGALGRDSRE